MDSLTLVYKLCAIHRFGGDCEFVYKYGTAVPRYMYGTTVHDHVLLVLPVVRRFYGRGPIKVCLHSHSRAGFNSYTPEVLPFANKHSPVVVSAFSRASHIVAPTHPTRLSARTVCCASTAHEYVPTTEHM